MKKRKLLSRILACQTNVGFGDAQRLVSAFGFRLERQSGSHHIFVHPQIPELINLQEVQGKAKPYQLRQFLALVEKHNLKIEED